jgi:hypothetical protein
MIQNILHACPKGAKTSVRHAGESAATLTAISDTKLVGRDRIDVKFSRGDSVTDAVPMNVHDFLHFGHFVLALRTAMDNGLVAESKIDHDRLRASWEPRSALVEWKLCSRTSDCN